MDRIEKRLLEIEKRLDRLESAASGGLTFIPNIIEESNYTQKLNSSIQESGKINPKEKKKRKLFEGSEELVGKYIIGIFATILLLIGTISFAMMIWGGLSNLIKLGIISTVGIILWFTGFYRSLKKINPINSIIMGSGICVTYVAIVSANINFGYINNIITILICSLWSILITLAYRRVKSYYLILISQIGGLVTLIYGLDISATKIDMLVMFIFALFLSVLVSAFTVNESVNKNIFSNIMSTVTFILILYYLAVRYNGMEFTGAIEYREIMQWIKNISILSLLCLYLLYNYLMFRHKDNKNITEIRVLYGIGIYLIHIVISYQVLWDYPIKSHNFLLISLICIVQYFINEIIYEEKDVKLLYIALSSFSILAFMTEKHNLVAGVSIFGLIMIIEDLYSKKFENKNALILLSLVDSILLNLNTSFLYFFGGIKGNIVIGVIALVLTMVAVVLYNDNEDKSHNYNSLAASALVILSYRITCNISDLILDFDKSSNWSNLIGYVFSVVILISTYQYGLFTQKENNKVDIIGKLIAGILYIVGIFRITSGSELPLILISFYSLATLIVLMYRTMISYTELKDNTIGKGTGLILIIQYLTFTWAFLYSFNEFSIPTFIYTVSGLIISLSAIYIGFKVRFTEIRRYGLILTILMVVKFITIDLNNNNSIKRIIALIIGSLICFIISIIYNQFSKNEKE